MKFAVYYDLAFGGAARALRLFVTHLRQNHSVDVFHPPGAWPVCGDSLELEGAGADRAHALYYLNRISQPFYYRRLQRAEKQAAARLRDYDRVLVHSCRGRGAPPMVRYVGKRAALYVTEPLRLYREPRPFDAEPPYVWRAARLLYSPGSRSLNQADEENGSQA